MQFGASAYTVAEGGTQTVTVTLGADPERTVTIPMTKVNQGTASDADYSGVPDSVVFASGETERSIIFSATQDTVDDDGESVKLTFGSSLPTGVTKGSTNEAIVSINDDDDAVRWTVSFGSATYNVTEGGTETVTVTLGAEPERTVIITLIPANQGGASDSDYSGVPASVTFGPTETSKTFTFTADDDAEDDDGERVILSFGAPLPDGVSEGTPNQSIVSITDNDAPDVDVQFGASAYTVAEGGTQTVTITLSADPERTVTIPMTKVNQGTASDADYSGVPDSVVFASGETERSIIFSATQDTVDDDGESVKLTFGSSLPTGVTKGSTNEAIVSITDDDVPSVEVSFGSATYNVTEGGTETVTVTLGAEPERTVIITLIPANQGGASDSDYSGVPASVTFGPTETSKTFTFTADDDAEDDDGERVILSFGAPLPDGVSEGTPNQSIVSITDNDAPDVDVQFGASAYTVAEGGTQTVTITLSADPERTVTIPMTKVNQGTASDADYSGVPDSVVFASGETERSIIFSATQDTVDDDGESVKLTFGSSLPTGVTKGSTNEAIVSITDDDVPSVEVSFGSATYNVTEGGTETVTVTLGAEPERTVIITLIPANQGGASDSDYSGVPASVTFGPTETSKTFTFTADDDAEDDDGERVILSFGAPLPDGVSEGTPNQSIVSITDNDAPDVDVQFGASAYTVAEGGTQTVTITLSADPERTVTIPMTKVNQGTASDADYSGVPDSVVFASGETERSIIFSATQDTVDDDGESVKLTFGSSLPTGVTKGSTNEAIVSITDDDVPSVEVSFGSATYNVTEGGTETVTVTLGAEPERTVIITLIPANQGGASDSDYSGVPASVTFGPTETSKTFTFTADDDAEDDDGRASSSPSAAPCPRGCLEGASLRRPSPSTTTTILR